MAKKKGSGVFATAQQIGKSLFLPIAILPIAGLLLGVGSSFTNETTIATYGLTGVLHPGTVLYSIMQLLKAAGGVVFDNLPLIFCLAVALGMSKKEKGVAVLSSALFYLVMIVTINVGLTITGKIVDGVPAQDVMEGSLTTMLGIQTLQLGVFGGIIAGIISAVLCNKFYKTKLPNALSFFAGTRFVPIVCIVFAMVTGAILFVVWPFVQSGIFKLGDLVQSSGYAGTFLYGLIERALIPFGLHHIFYMPFWQTGVGGSMMIDGTLVEGAQNIFFAQLASPNTTKFSVDATRFLAGKYPFMMGGLPGAALAMYTCAKPDKRKMAGSLLLSVALTSFITGITEPIEFTFLFLAPVLFVVHAVLAGLSFMICHILEVGVGTTFSDGLIDLILYGVLPGQQKTNWLVLIPVILVYFVIYFVIFRIFILKMNLNTPGRGEGSGEMKMVTKDEYLKSKGTKNVLKPVLADDPRSATILKGVGGVDNLEEIDCCATRLRLSVKDSSLVDEELLKSTGASGVVIKGDALQVIYGPSVTIVKTDFEEFVDMIRNGEFTEADAYTLLGEGTEESKDDNQRVIKVIVGEVTYGAHMNGKVVRMEDIEDETFASGILGDSVAIQPSEGKLYSPCNGKVNMVFDTKHAVSIDSVEGSEILLHIGIDTVKLNGEFFETKVEPGDEVRVGDVLVEFDMDKIKEAGYKLTTPMIICNSFDYSSVETLAEGDIKVGEPLLKIK